DAGQVFLSGGRGGESNGGEQAEGAEDASSSVCRDRHEGVLRGADQQIARPAWRLIIIARRGGRNAWLRWATRAGAPCGRPLRRSYWIWPSSDRRHGAIGDTGRSATLIGDAGYSSSTLTNTLSAS